MRVRPVVFVLLLSWLLPQGARADSDRLLLLFTGDNGGEVSDCGCHHLAAGGLARRKTAIARERGQSGAVLVLDSGNALFKSARSASEPNAQARATLLLEQMDAWGTAAMAVGARDLVLGPGWLQQVTRQAKMKLVSANLVDARGKPLFVPSTVVTVGGERVGVVGLSPEGELAPGVVGQPPGPAALAEARRLRAREKLALVVVLAARPMDQARRIARQVEGSVDFILQSHEGRLPGVAQHEGSVTLLPSGERGRQLGRLELRLRGAGPFFDVTEVTRAREGLRLLEENLSRAEHRLESEPDAATRRSLTEALEGLRARRQELSHQAAMDPETATRTQRLSFVALGPYVAEDPELKQRAERIAPPGAETP